MARESRRKRDEKRFGKPTRLADIFVSTPAEKFLMSDASREMGCIENIRFLQNDIAGSTIIVADNVMDFYAENPQEFWDYERDFPSCMPPFTSFVIEMHGPAKMRAGNRYISTTREGQAPPNRVGILFQAKDAKEMDFKYPRPIHGVNSFDVVRIPDARWFVRACPLYVVDGMPMFHSSVKYYAVDNKGVVIESPSLMTTEVLPPGRTLGELRCEIAQILMPAMLAISFMNCKNTSVDAVSPDPATSRQRKKAGLKPFLRYHTINIEPVKATLRTEGGIETNGLKKALHICRGHFCTYTEERPLFGHFVGTVWKPSHVRGSAKNGVVISDYNVKAPTPTPEQP